MTNARSTLREAMSDKVNGSAGREMVTATIDRAKLEEIARDGAIRYRGFVSRVNRAGDKEIERALRTA